MPTTVPVQTLPVALSPVIVVKGGAEDWSPPESSYYTTVPLPPPRDTNCRSIRERINTFILHFTCMPRRHTKASRGNKPKPLDSESGKKDIKYRHVSELIGSHLPSSSKTPLAGYYSADHKTVLPINEMSPDGLPAELDSGPQQIMNDDDNGGDHFTAVEPQRRGVRRGRPDSGRHAQNHSIPQDHVWPPVSTEDIDADDYIDEGIQALMDEKNAVWHMHGPELLHGRNDDAHFEATPWSVMQILPSLQVPVRNCAPGVPDLASPHNSTQKSSPILPETPIAAGSALVPYQATDDSFRYSISPDGNIPPQQPSFRYNDMEAAEFPKSFISPHHDSSDQLLGKITINPPLLDGLPFDSICQQFGDERFEDWLQTIHPALRPDYRTDVPLSAPAIPQTRAFDDKLVDQERGLIGTWELTGREWARANEPRFLMTAPP